MKTLRYTILALLLCFCGVLYAQIDIRERVYLQTDKQVYLAGEYLWLKLYLTDEQGRPSAFSKVGYVELSDGAAARVQLIVAIENGVGEGRMELPSRLATGYYRLIAYTRQMQNEGEAVYAHKTVGLVNTYRTDLTVGVDTALSAPVTAPAASSGLRVSASRASYPARSQGEIRIEGLPADVHSLALSIAGAEFIPVPDATDIVSWQTQLSAIPRKAFTQKQLPEYEGHIIRAKITGDASDVHPLLGFVGDNIHIYGGKTDDEGNVLFFTENVGDIRRVAATLDASGSTTGQRIEIVPPFATHTAVTMPPFSLNPAWAERLSERSVGIQALYAFMSDSMSAPRTIFPFARWQTDYSYNLDEYTRFDRMPEMFLEFIPYLSFRNFNGKRRLSVLQKDFSHGNSLVLLDGIPIADHDFIYSYSPRLLKRVDIYQGRFYFGGQLFEGVVAFSSFNNDYPSLQSGDNVRIFEYAGAQNPFRFFVPDHSAGQQRIPDHRHTLLWMPEIPVGDSSATTIPFATSDLRGTFLITVEGLTANGAPLRATASFRVE